VDVQVTFSGRFFHVGHPTPPGRSCTWRDAATASRPAHIAFQARSREEVDAFHSAAVANGATDIGEPGVRSTYSDGYSHEPTS
jgi:hypothetical protein